MMSRSKYYSGAIAVLIIGLIITIGLFLKLKLNKSRYKQVQQILTAYGPKMSG